MQELLYLVHRFPYPPNKGDKIRSYHLLKHLTKYYRVHLGTFIDDEKDHEYLDKVKGLCAETCIVDLHPRTERLRSLIGLLYGQPLTLPYYRNTHLQAWVNRILENRPLEHIVVFSSGMAQYVRGAVNAQRIIDFVDIDSDKWLQYSASTSWPLSWIYRRESKLLLEYERCVACEFDSATFVSETEADLFKQLSREAAEKVTYFNNGVDAEYFSPLHGHTHPYPKESTILVFVGAMDYWANIDAVEWFARAVLPKVRSYRPDVEFYIVGARPAAAVMSLAALPGVTVTGSVPDVRPYLAHAFAAVAPLRIARGIQNKVLEAMAMEQIVIASPQALEGIGALPGKELLVAKDENEFADKIIRLLREVPGREIGRAARIRVLNDYSWKRSMERVDALLAQPKALRNDLPLHHDLQHYFESNGR
jgi:sugar transferase (PEP-CTERM/EpsH1 system associated)